MDFELDFGNPVVPTESATALEIKPVIEVSLDSLDEERIAAVRQLDVKAILGGSLQHLVLTPAYLLHTSAADFATHLQKVDILHGTYEGGFKLWNCAGDVIHFCKDHNIVRPEHVVLDAGCGHGLLGIHALQAGASFVCFQDYNTEVLQELTIPNVALNLLGLPPELDKVQALRGRLAFWAGDWDAFPPVNCLERWQFDLILCSDVLYTAESTAKLLRFICKHMKATGSAYIGTKSFYFGCGGGALELEELVAKDKGLQMERVARCGGTGDLQREILRLSFITGNV
eukprot:GGOE01018094.1.p1 GENE.GGOE01018094.1~~GGOE01018094.1.p1  ORF type:complete len:286 (-),score=79.68 GGOE01018094.1:100-957(-)